MEAFNHIAALRRNSQEFATLMVLSGRGSTSFIQRKLFIGYNAAARLVERMESDGILSKSNYVGKREVLVRATRKETPDAE